MCLQLSSGRVPDASQHHIRIDVGDLLQRQPPARRIPGGNPGCHREDAECGDLHVDAEKLALADPVFELFLKHVLILVAKRHDARPLSAIQAPKLAVADENLFRPLTVKLDVVINEEAHPLDNVGLLGNLALVLEKRLHDRLHDVEEQLTL